MQKKILIIEDDKEISAIEKDYLEHAGFIVTCAYTGDNGLDAFAEDNPDLVILDLNLPKIDGIEICNIIRRKSGVPIIMVTARTREIDELLGLGTGADDYLKKPFSPKVLVARVKALLKRTFGNNGAAKIIHHKDLTIDAENQTVMKGHKQIELTTVQFNILFLLATNPGRLFNRNEIIEGTYDTYDYPDIFDRTIDSHIKNIRKAIEKDPKKPEYLLTVYGKGYKFTTAPIDK